MTTSVCGAVSSGGVISISTTSVGVTINSLPQENKNKNNKLIILVITITGVAATTGTRFKVTSYDFEDSC